MVSSIRLVLTTLVVGVSFGCNGEEPSSESCRPAGTNCPAQCTVARAERYDALRSCRESTILGCRGSEETDSDFTCATRKSDNSVWLGSSTLLSDPELYDRCPDDLAAEARASALGCP